MNAYQTKANADPQWHERKKLYKREWKKKKMACPEYRAKHNAKEVERNKKDREKVKARGKKFYEKLGISKSEYQHKHSSPSTRRRLHREGYQRTIRCAAASFRRGELSFDEFVRRLHDFAIRTNEKLRA